LDYLNIAKEAHMGVIILNPNANQIKLRVLSLDQPVGNFSAQHTYDIPEHNTHISHVLSIYDKFIAQCQAKDLYFVANGRGGDTLLQLLNHRLDQPAPAPVGDAISTLKRQAPTVSNNLQRLRAIAFINSAHSTSYAKNDRVKSFIEERSVHWLTSSQPLDTAVPEQSDNFGCTCVSSEHTKADFAAASAVNSVFEFFFGRIPPNETKPDWNPIQIAFSNPPQNMHVQRELNNADAREHDLFASDSFGQKVVDSTTPDSQSLFDFPHDSVSSGSSTPPRSSNHSRINSSHSNHQASIHEFSLPPHQNSRQIEMVEMGTQTDPISRGREVDDTEPHAREIEGEEITPTPKRERAHNPGHLTIHPVAITICPFCRISGWLQGFKTRIFISLALVVAGLFAARVFVGFRRPKSQTGPSLQTPTSKRYFFFQPS
jgi:hypothetical protein